MGGLAKFLEARDFLLAHRTDYEYAYRHFNWPNSYRRARFEDLGFRMPTHQATAACSKVLDPRLLSRPLSTQQGRISLRTVSFCRNARQASEDCWGLFAFRR